MQDWSGRVPSASIRLYLCNYRVRDSMRRLSRIFPNRSDRPLYYHCRTILSLMKMQTNEFSKKSLFTLLHILTIHKEPSYPTMAVKISKSINYVVLLRKKLDGPFFLLYLLPAEMNKIFNVSFCARVNC